MPTANTQSPQDAPKRRGRPSATPEQRAAWKRVRTLRLSDEHWSKLQAVGTSRLERWLDKVRP
jgi:hypothetical protein